jgi:CRISPR-associated endonuclease/helicase Cas3
VNTASVGPRDTSVLWAKTGPSGSYHPLVLHLLDVAACADALIEREPATTRDRFGGILGLAWPEARPWLLLIIACHDLGKACPGFQLKWGDIRAQLATARLSIPRIPNTAINHAFVSQIALSHLLHERGWAQGASDLLGDAVGCHHGSRCSPLTLEKLAYDRNAIGDGNWAQARRELFDSLDGLFRPETVPAVDLLSGPDFMLLAGLTSFADWIGSNVDWFPFGTPQDCLDLDAWWSAGRQKADRALTAIGWNTREPLSSGHQDFESVFHFAPRSLQAAVASVVEQIATPSILLVEAPMGEGKTEAAFFAHLELQRHLGHRGLYVALPTKATGNAMFERAMHFLQERQAQRPIDLQLLHGAVLLNDKFQSIRLGQIHDTEEQGQIRAGEWFTHKKRALLSEYGVGTVDQALLSILPVRHNFVRMWGLANRVVVLDEVHAYDAYTGTLLLHLVRWLHALGSSVILLSATLPPAFRRKLADVVGAKPPISDALYPRLSVFGDGKVTQVPFDADPARRCCVRLQAIGPDVGDLHASADRLVAGGGLGIVLVNTVQRAQELYRSWPTGRRLFRKSQCVGKQLEDGTEIFLFHARFPADRRQAREEAVLSTFGKKGTRDGRKLLIATQVAEQSLDLDLDWMITDLAPIDLVLQRVGRVWRHPRAKRPLPEPLLVVTGLNATEPPEFGDPLWWGYVYREDLLLRSWALLKTRENLNLPDEIDPLVQVVYEALDDAVPETLRERLAAAECEAEGKRFASRGQADREFIGFPDNPSWNEPARFVKGDEDEPGLHPTLIAQTRLGEPSVLAIPLFPGEEQGTEPDHAQAKTLAMRAVSLSRRRVTSRLFANGVPKTWLASPLLRNSFPLILDENGCWVDDPTVRLDEELGLVYGTKEAS